MNRETEIVEGLRAFLTGLGSRNRDALDVVAKGERWPELAAREMERRAVALLTGLPEVELDAIARKTVSLSELARQVQSDIGKE